MNNYIESGAAMFKAITFLLIFLLMGTPISASNPIRTAEDVSVSVNIAINVYNLDDTVIHNEPAPTCSGFVVSSKGTDAVIATAGHCAERVAYFDDDGSAKGDVETVPKYVRFFDGDVGTVTHIWFSRSPDVALLWIHSMRHHPAARFSLNVYRGQSLYVFGSPLGIEWSLARASSMRGTLGMILDGKESSWNGAYVIECAGCAPGTSGAGVFDETGAVVGQIVAANGAQLFMTPTYQLLKIIGKR